MFHSHCRVLRLFNPLCDLFSDRARELRLLKDSSTASAARHGMDHFSSILSSLVVLLLTSVVLFNCTKLRLQTLSDPPCCVAVVNTNSTDYIATGRSCIEGEVSVRYFFLSLPVTFFTPPMYPHFLRTPTIFPHPLLFQYQALLQD